jgi:hypothetical protein
MGWRMGVSRGDRVKAGQGAVKPSPRMEALLSKAPSHPHRSLGDYFSVLRKPSVKVWRLYPRKRDLAHASWMLRLPSLLPYKFPRRKTSWHWGKQYIQMAYTPTPPHPSLPWAQNVHTASQLFTLGHKPQLRIINIWRKPLTWKIGARTTFKHKSADGHGGAHL